ncbi:MAG: hypothetical protein QOI06_1373 [Nocardioidaceae bacterium]|jgi:hypothetical protein|nr:hypothetical protein [Nocardioidaceae bacterium]
MFDEQLRVDLRREAEALPSDEGTALTAIYGRAARRRRIVRVARGAVVVTLVLTVAVTVSARFIQNVGKSPGPASRPTPTAHTSTSPQVVPAAGSSLIGEWQSGSIPVVRLSSDLTSAGVSSADAERLFSGARQWVVQMTFSTSLGVQTWDPAKPGATLKLHEDFSYRLLPGSRIVVTMPHPTTSWYLSYRLARNQLHLHFLQARGKTDAAETARFRAWTTEPLTLVH